MFREKNSMFILHIGSLLPETVFLVSGSWCIKTENMYFVKFKREKSL